MAGGGGAWKVAYADFVTAMMAFFMVMWLIAQSESVKEAIADHFSHADPWSIYPASDAGSPPVGPDKKAMPPHGKSHGYSQQDANHEKELKKTRMGLRRDHSTPGLVAILYFEDPEVALDDAAKERVDTFVTTARGKPHKIEIRGHASRRPLPAEGRFQDAWELCYVRCRSVMQYLVEQGIEAERVRLSQAGVHEPLSSSTDAVSLGRNARVDIVLLDELSQELDADNETRNEPWN